MAGAGGTAAPERPAGRARLRRLAPLLGLASVLLLPALLEFGPAGLAAADSTAMAVTSDTPAYCHALARRLRQEPSLPAEAQALEQTGYDMCTRGEIRGGIRRLRQALALIQRQGGR